MWRTLLTTCMLRDKLETYHVLIPLCYLYVIAGGPHHAGVTVDRPADLHVTPRPATKHSYTKRTTHQKCCLILIPRIYINITVIVHVVKVLG